SDGAMAKVSTGITIPAYTSVVITARGQTSTNINPDYACCFHPILAPYAGMTGGPPGFGTWPAHNLRVTLWLNGSPVSYKPDTPGATEVKSDTIYQSTSATLYVSRSGVAGGSAGCLSSPGTKGCLCPSGPCDSYFAAKYLLSGSTTIEAE